MRGNQATFGEFSDDSPDLWDFSHYGPAADRPIQEAEREAMFMSGGEPVDRREIPDSGLSLTDITDWPYINREESNPNERDNFTQKMSEIHDSDESQENSSENAERGRFLPTLQTIYRRETDTYTPGQGTALDKVRALERKAELRDISEWSTVEIEATLYNLGHLMTELRIAAGDHPGPNCKNLSRDAEALHQDLIDELQARDRWTADTRQYLTNSFGSICSGIEYGNKPQYTAENVYFEEIQNLTDIGDRITAIFEDGDGLEICEGCGHKMVSGDWDVCADCADADDDQEADEDGQDDNDRRITTRAVGDEADEELEAVADGGQEIREPKDEPEPGDEVLLIENPAVGLNTSPNIVNGEVSSTGKTIDIPADELPMGSSRRLDASEIFAGESEYRDSTSYELYTPGRLRSLQRSNYAPGPQAGSNGKTDIGELPEPTHWPAGDDPDDAPDDCPKCGESPGRWKGEGKPRCERCGEIVDPDADDHHDDDGPDKWDLEQYERGDVLTLEKHRGEFLIIGYKEIIGGPRVALDVLDQDGDVFRLRKVDAGGYFFDVRPGHYDGGQFRESGGMGGSPVVRNVDAMDDAQDFEVIDHDDDRLRRWIRENSQI